MSFKPFVYFVCQTCKWKHNVPDEHVVMNGPFPVSRYTVFHECEGGADVEERGGIEGELVCEHPAQNFKITLE